MSGNRNRTNAETNGGNRRFFQVMAIIEFTPDSPRALWRDVIGWILGKIAFRVEPEVPDRFVGLVERLR